MQCSNANLPYKSCFNIFFNSYTVSIAEEAGEGAGEERDEVAQERLRREWEENDDASHEKRAEIFGLVFVAKQLGDGAAPNDGMPDEDVPPNQFPSYLFNLMVDRFNGAEGPEREEEAENLRTIMKSINHDNAFQLGDPLESLMAAYDRLEGPDGQALRVEFNEWVKAFVNSFPANDNEDDEEEDDEEKEE